MMSHSELGGERGRDDELMAIPRLAERIGVTPRVLRYWEEQQLISPTREHGKLRYSPRDPAIAAPRAAPAAPRARSPRQAQAPIAQPRHLPCCRTRPCAVQS